MLTRLFSFFLLGLAIFLLDLGTIQPVLAQNSAQADTVLGIPLAEPPAPPLLTEVTPKTPSEPSVSVSASVSSPSDLATLTPRASGTETAESFTLSARPALVTSGHATWDEAFIRLNTTFRSLEAELSRQGVRAAGRPLTIFIETDETGFRFDAMLPLSGPLPLPPASGYRKGETLSGKVLRFLHKGPYDDIDSTYETITAWLDAKGIAVKEAFTEELVRDAKSEEDPDLEIQIYVQPR
jgi:effector-binding domain-containing protein